MLGASRESDARLLDWLGLSAEGISVKEIADHYNVKPKTVEQAMYRVRKDDREAHKEAA